MRALIIDEPWVGWIISGEKTWEMRSRNTRVRGRIGLIRKGSKAVVGTADLIEILPNLSVWELQANVARHLVPADEIREHFKWRTAWVLHHARPLGKPVPYQHPRGAVIWVRLDLATIKMVEEQNRDGRHFTQAVSRSAA